MIAIADHSRLCQLGVRSRTSGLATLIVVGACAGSPKELGPTLVLAYTQPGVPADVDALVQLGAHAWRDYGVSSVPAGTQLDLPPCPYDWWTGTGACSITIAITFDAISTLGGAWGVSYVDTRDTELAYPDELPELAIGGCNAAHELGHQLWHATTHLPPGGAGIMAQFYAGTCYVEPTDTDRAWVNDQTGWAR